ncbi:MAG: NAD(P)/FAD-dependent oxidoreductase [Bacteroidetes bacterium]|jgi:cation diffusion facilitator CzcD-associated flavoprotein CzcO|nr:NAD(P)/FAD-dependent oxidoreductase [Bacteroidota bacterium]MDF1868668.1 NAD(P)/FAD-dependent oxidoreductase [Saprospiraceae bacterium]
MNQRKEYLDVLIVGAGLSGIGAAHHIQTKCPDRTYAILEARPTMGGTWDLFRYPGIRSDSDMYTLGYAFRPWKEQKAIADGPSILNYIKETAESDGSDQKIRYNHKVKNATWSSKTAQWTVEVEQIDSGEMIEIACNFLFMCSGYYRYEAGFTPDFKGREDFEGRIVHPQKWTSDINYEDKKVVVIGSGATAVTLVPELAKKAKLVTMLQRSPTYIMNAPSIDPIASFLRKILPNKLAYFLSRWKNILMGILFYKVARSKPNFTSKLLKAGVKKAVSKEIDINKHFTPKYKPWDQRLCLVPDSDLFEAINKGKATIVTDHIEKFTKEGIQLESGEHLEADIIVTATGLKMQLLGNMELTVDEKPINYGDLYAYRGMMFNDVPNMAMAFGYTNASWTLKSDLTCEYVCRLLNHMKATGTKVVTPRQNDPNFEEEPIIDFNSGYVLRELDKLPKQGTKRPWKVFQNYLLDVFNFRFSKLEDGFLEFK